MDLKRSSAYLGLAAASILALGANPAEAATLKFGTDGLKFDIDTIANFIFESSQGQYRSTFGIFEVATEAFTPLFREIQPFDSESNDFRSTCGEDGSAINNCTASFKFLANVEYSFALESTFEGAKVPTVYSTTALNNAAKGFTEQAEFSGDNPVANPVLVAFEDQPLLKGKLIDYNDFKVSVKAETKPTESIPEPAALAGLALVGAAILTRRRRVNQSA